MSPAAPAASAPPSSRPSPQEGARVAIGASRHADEARAMAKDLPSERRQAYRRAGGSLRPAADRARGGRGRSPGLGGLDIFVHSAGIDVTQTAPTHETSDELWDRMMTLHLTAAFRLSKRSDPGAAERQEPVDRLHRVGLRPGRLAGRRRLQRGQGGPAASRAAASPPTTPSPDCAPMSSRRASSTRR